ncbi:SDR family oxidoreductase [Marinilactibacillus psychrotolerans]|uniref:SDR family oxidoreductase n=1 Tax=Marinilactibacillus psychrotolerans TaxID=191770 RepID=A0A5R9C280_9LACT|nr:SDR family oxidoreductase [Marinilactibacillus psychrotolerans]TLQ06832.1 SDR family oxidoreductase [Marinilactibacillus psychrotolerans]
MNILVVGANGQIGTHLVEKLKNTEMYKPVAFVRKEEQVTKFEDKGIEARLGNLESSVTDLKKSMKDIDAIVFTAGSGGSTGTDKTMLIDLDGAVKVMEAAEDMNIKRFIMVSAFQADVRENWSEEMKPYFAAKHYADKFLMNSDLNYTIIRPGMLENKPAIGKIALTRALTEASDPMTIPREDVAQLILEALENDRTFLQSFDVTTGDQEITEALKGL